MTILFTVLITLASIAYLAVAGIIFSTITYNEIRKFTEQRDAYGYSFIQAISISAWYVVLTLVWVISIPSFLLIGIYKRDRAL